MSSAQGYHPPDQVQTSQGPAGASGPTIRAYHNCIARDAEVLRSRGVSPRVAAARGYRTAGNALIIPLHNTQGEQDPDDIMRRPHDPPIGPDGKKRKYLFRAGAKMMIDVHPLSLPYIEDPRIPLIATESPLKADAIQSAIETGTFCVISFPGVWNWVSGVPLADFRDIMMRDRQGERIMHRRRVYIAFDSDALTNPNVTRARWEIGQFLDRKKADPWYIDVPPAPDGGKQGIDDALVAGHKLDAMIGSAYPAPEKPPHLPDAEASEIEVLQAQVAQLQKQLATTQRKLVEKSADYDALERFYENPHMTPTQKVVLVRTGRLAMEAKAAGKQEKDGNVVIAPAEIANDYRPKDTTGQRNPKDGTRIVAARKVIPATLRDLRALATLDFAERHSTKKDKKTGRRYMNDIVLEAPQSMAGFLRPFAWYEPPTTVDRKQRTTTPKPTACPHCHEVHDWEVTTTCTGCDKVIRTRTIDHTSPPVPEPAAPEVETSSEWEPLGDKLSPNVNTGSLVDKVFPNPPDPLPSRPPGTASLWPLERGTYVIGHGHIERVGDSRAPTQHIPQAPGGSA